MPGFLGRFEELSVWARGSVNGSAGLGLEAREGTGHPGAPGLEKVAGPHSFQSSHRLSLMLGHLLLGRRAQLELIIHFSPRVFILLIRIILSLTCLALVSLGEERQGGRRGAHGQPARGLPGSEGLNHPPL